MIYFLSLLVSSLAFADSCKFGAVEFDFSHDSDRTRSLVIKGDKPLTVKLPRAGEYIVNMAQAEDGKGSLCMNSAVYPLGGDKVAVLFETIDASYAETFLTVFDFKTRTFEKKPPQSIFSWSGILTEKTDKGFAFRYTPSFGEEDGLREGTGKAAGLNLAIDKSDLWKRVEMGEKGVEIKLDRELTWKNSRWNKYITNRAEFEKTFRMSDPRAADKVQVFSGFSREAKKDCILVEYTGDRKSFCRPVTSANL